MLVLTRKLGERIDITTPGGNEGRRIRLTVLEIRSGQVKLGLDAERDVVIHRSEIQDRVDAERAAVQ